MIQLQRKGRGGKEVTIISGLALNGMELLALLQQLKSTLGTGGTLKQQNLEIQGNRVEAIQAALSAKGINAKISGG